MYIHSLSGINAGKSILDTLTRPNLQQQQQTSFPQPRVTLSTTAGIAHTTSIAEGLTNTNRTLPHYIHSYCLSIVASLPKALLFEPAKNVSILNLIKPNQTGVPRNIPPTTAYPNPNPSLIPAQKFASSEPVPVPITDKVCIS